jgi:hypothetical protein
VPEKVKSQKAAPQKVATANVTAEESLLSIIAEFGPDVVFFTSREHPIKDLSEITSGNQTGCWDNRFSIPMFKLVNALTGKPTTRVIGDGYFHNLFAGEAPDLRLFATWNIPRYIENISGLGGGIRVVFIAKKTPDSEAPPK